VQQEIVLALLAKEPSHGYELRARIEQALGGASGGVNAGQVYVTLRRLEQAGLVVAVAATAGRLPDERPDRKVFELTAAGRERLGGWLGEVRWPRPDLTDFHLKLVAVAGARLADPVALVAAHRRELARRLKEAQRAALAQEDESRAGLLLAGMVLRIRADLDWLDECERVWRLDQ
jgi:DNA-binding PadR family transcriptional regulator